MKKVKQESREQYRISIDQSHHLTYQKLAKRLDKESPEEEKDTRPFESMKNLFLLATFIGYKNKKRVPLEKGRGIFNWQTFSSDEVSLLFGLAVAETNHIEVLSDQKQLLKIAEEYANGGIIQIEEEVMEMPGDKIENLLDLLANWIPPEDSIQGLVENSVY